LPPLDTNDLIKMVVSLIVKLLEGTQGKGVCGNKKKRSVNAFKSLNANISPRIH
jgi:hypothetical protein